MSDEPVFFDTNVLVYANDNAYPEKRKCARSLIFEAIRSGTGCISAQVLAEFWVTVTRKIKIPLDTEIAREQMALFMSFKVQAVDAATVLEALRIQDKHRLSYRDAQILACAGFARATRLYSEDLQDGAEYEGITILNPFRGKGGNAAPAASMPSQNH